MLTRYTVISLPSEKLPTPPADLQHRRHSPPFDLRLFPVSLPGVNAIFMCLR